MAEEASLRAAFRKHGQEADDAAAPLTPTYQDLVSVRKALTAIEAQDKTQSSSAHPLSSCTAARNFFHAA